MTDANPWSALADPPYEDAATDTVSGAASADIVRGAAAAAAAIIDAEDFDQALLDAAFGLAIAMTCAGFPKEGSMSIMEKALVAAEVAFEEAEGNEI